MTDKTRGIKPKRLPKGQRKHVRRLKQAAREAGIAYIRPIGARRSEPPKKEDHP